jgi:hypothetical protein
MSVVGGDEAVPPLPKACLLILGNVQLVVLCFLYASLLSPHVQSITAPVVMDAFIAKKIT